MLVLLHSYCSVTEQAHIDAGGVDLDELRDDGDEVVLQGDTSVAILHQARRKTHDVGLDPNACSAAMTTVLKMTIIGVCLFTCCKECPSAGSWVANSAGNHS